MKQWEQLPDGKIKLSSSVLEASELYAIARGVAQNALAERPEFKEPETAAAYLCQAIGHEEREQFAVLFLDTKHKLIQFEIMFSGTIDGASVYPREIVKAALMCNATALIISHNHPTGNTGPSQQDIEITKRIKAACELVELRLLDHLIVSGSGFYHSLARERLF